MKKHLMFIVMLGLLVRTGGVAYAEDADVFVGYSYEQDNFVTGAGLHGYNLAATWNLTPKVGIEANLAGHHGNTIAFSQTVPVGAITNKDDIFTYLFGPKLTHEIGPSNKFAAFTHFLVGGSRVHSSSQNSGSFGTASSSIGGSGFAFAVGGGLDWIPGTWGIRILEVDFVRSSSITTTTSCGGTCVQKQGGSTAPNFRFSTGLIWRSGMR